MSKPKHTPGPWRVKRSTHFVEGIIKEYHWVGFGMIGDETPVLSRTLPENEANARLIAAAPELLEAAKHALTAIETAQLTIPKAELTLMHRSIRELMDAIAKAEGNE